MSDMRALQPRAALLAKVGSILVHIDEMISDDGHHFDKAAIEALLRDTEVNDWLEAMARMSLVPLKRKTNRFNRP